MNRSHALQREEDARRHHGERNVLIGYLLYFLKSLVCLSDLDGDRSRFTLETLQLLDELIVLQDLTLRLVEGVEELVFCESQLFFKLALVLQ